jgi:uncharacterized protein YdeI (YjbR/CyaY-like superfamily)
LRAFKKSLALIMEQYDPRVDAFIGKSAPFAQPILQHIRALIHETSPLITETIKWSCPFFDYKGTLCHMNAFKVHVGFGFWDSRALTDPGNYLKRGDEKDAVGNFGRITTLADLPPDHILQEFIRQAMAANEKGAKSSRPIAPKKPESAKAELVTPPDFEAMLTANPKAQEVFDKFSYSHRKEYLTWIIDAKSEATRQKRMEQAIEWMAEGKSRHWKYQ